MSKKERNSLSFDRNERFEQQMFDIAMRASFAFFLGFLCGILLLGIQLVFAPSTENAVTATKELDAGTEDNKVFDNSNSRTQDKEEHKVSYAILLTSPISGSEFTVDQLDRIPGVEFSGEEGFVKYTTMGVRERDKYLNLTWETYLRGMLSAFPTPKEDTKYIGVKIMYNQIPPQLMKKFARWLNEEQATVIHLRRLTAAIQLESQVSKIQRVILSKGTDPYIDHCHIGTGCNRTKTAKVVFGNNTCPNWELQIHTIEENQEYFSDFLRVHASMATTLEVIYEDLSGPYQDKHLDALAAFMGAAAGIRRGEQTEKSPVKAGELTCEDRIDGLGGPEYLLLANLHRSRVMCLSLSNQVNKRVESNSNLFLPDDTPLRYQFYSITKQGPNACAKSMASHISRGA